MNQTQFIKVVGLGISVWAVLIGLTGLPVGAQESNVVKTTESTNAPVTPEVVVAEVVPSTSTNETGSQDFKSFSIITSRNIFSPTRVTPTARAEAKHIPKVDLISLVGTLRSSRGQTAFFDGSSSGYRGAVKLTNQIAGFTLEAISADSVKLEAKGKSLMLKIGSQLRREDEGDWQISETAIPVATTETSSAKSSSEDSSGSTGGESDVLKRLLQKREQELNNEKR